MSDRASRTTPAKNAESITPSDSGVIESCRGLWVGGAGDITVDFRLAGTNVTIAGVPAGTLLPIDVSRVYSTGTDATSILALY